MKKIFFICGIGLALLVINSCKQDVRGPITKDSVAPGPISNVTVINLNGAAKISYSVPADADLLYVKASYKTKQGVVRETKVSRYNSDLTVVGFGDTSAYQVTLYAVDKSENASSPLEVTVHPLTPTVKIVRDSLTVTPDFGGINIKFFNSTEESMAIVVLTNDSLGQFSPINTNYTNLKKGDFSIRGLPSTPTKFGVFVRDRWGNLSDTLIVTLTPLFEELLDRTKMKGLVLPTDAPLGYNGTIAGLFDGNTQDGFYHTGDAARMPQWFTYDMGVTAKLSRLSWFMRPGFFYTLHNPRVVEIWGSNNPNPDGSYDSSWTLLVVHTQIKPSGLPEGQLSQADIDAATAGETVTFPLNTPKVRYIRFKTLKNWSNGTYVNFYELMMWGDTK
ncbi:protein of unknown function [Mucilaginibacter pineti]|uniref:F5/8 type C domain-containing protein n=1 Tax=Mucilaginibacter pineti TaxID=1391627 RepID=A0A1G7LYD6_9SPHI|nr:DUF5000 domain-containing lipoprotein [Mucilaginibacter pineti]SDF54578.1 protein of unknown function [Mucilaginibacter pineti]